MTKAIKYESDEWKVSRVSGSFGGHDDEDIYTPYGIVEVYYVVSDGFALRYIHNGRLHQRTYKKRMSYRGIVTKAARFAKEIVNGVKQNG